MGRELPKAGVYGVIDEQTVPVAMFGAAAREMAEAGCGFIQLRMKESHDGDRLEAQRQVTEALLHVERPIWLCVNDRPDLAHILAEEAHSLIRPVLHLGQDDLDAKSARRIVGDAVVIGLSTHNPTQVMAAQACPVDYLGFGPVFTTGSKAEPDPTVGIQALKNAVKESDLPIVAIGGISLTALADVGATGARWGASIAAVLGGLDWSTTGWRVTLRTRLANAVQAFLSGRGQGGGAIPWSKEHA
jgi:thiamine-phosphate pyrophosphorylase